MQNNEKKYDLEERTAVFGEEVVKLCKLIRYDIVSEPIINQLVRSATSVGANYLEANGASSRKDFKNKIFICKKEAQESRHWLRMLKLCCSSQKGKIEFLEQESKELSMIFHKIASSIS
jgi:four helix bundle protein